MTQNNIGVSSTVKLPIDYRIYNVNENILLKQYDSDIGFYKVINRDSIPFVEKQDTSHWLLSAGGDYNAGTISDWLEPQNNVLYILAVSLLSDRNMEVRFFIPSSDQLFGIKSTPDVAITPEISPWKNPTVTIYAWLPSSTNYGKSFIPNFKIKNPTEYSNTLLKIGITGFSYELEPIDKPSVYETINMGIIRG